MTRELRFLDQNIKLKLAIMQALNELGVPGEGYPTPVANAVELLKEALLESVNDSL